MDHSIAIPALVAFFITLILGPGLISFLHKLKFGQFIREEGPESHLKKSGTPTMGGIIIMLGIGIVTIASFGFVPCFFDFYYEFHIIATSWLIFSCYFCFL